MSILWYWQQPASSKTFLKLGQELVSDSPTVSYGLTGMLYATHNGHLMLAAPNALMRGIFAAITEPGAELPPGPDGKPNAHITVAHRDELASIGGVAKITERGKSYHYTVGRFVTVKPEGWTEMDRVWFLTVHSPELQALRRSYGLSSLPRDGKHQFHITCGVRRRAVLGRNEKAKGAS